MKTFLEPLILRRGQPIVTFIDKDDHGYWLGTYHQFVGRDSPAKISDYHAVSRTRISKEFFDACRKEAAANHRRYRVRKSHPSNWSQL